MVIAAVIAARVIVSHFEPMLREQAVQYLHEHFHSDVELSRIRISLPKMSTFDMLLRRGRGIAVNVEGEGLSMRFGGARDLPPLFTIRKLGFRIDLGMLTQKHKTVDSVWIDGMQIHIPPKGARPDLDSPGENKSSYLDVDMKTVEIRDATLVLLPRDPHNEQLRFEIGTLYLTSVEANAAMKYDAALTIPKPRGALRSQGTFGPWAASDPGDTPLKGTYDFQHADLGVFDAIGGTLASTGTFEGTLDAVQVRGQADVPDFRLKSVGNSIRLSTRFEALVDGGDGDTVLQPVQARLGNTAFTTTGAVIKHEKENRRSITLRVAMSKGDMRDLLRVAAKGPPFMEGFINLKASITIPPLTSTVRKKLILAGTFDLRDATFLKSTIQSQIDQLSRRGQGQPKNEEIDQVASDMKGSFRMENQVMTFRSLSFDVPGAGVLIAGKYDLGRDVVDFRGSLALDARISQTMTGWKHWVLKPVDPFFAKHGAGTFLHIQVEGSSSQPKFGLGHSSKNPEERQPPAA